MRAVTCSAGHDPPYAIGDFLRDDAVLADGLVVVIGGMLRRCRTIVACGCRVLATRAGLEILSFYDQGGVLRYQMDEHTGLAADYIYLGHRGTAG